MPRLASTTRARLRRGLLGVILVLYGLSIPWYRSGGEQPGRWLGLPDWVAVAVVCYFAIAVLNALAWVLTDVADADAASGSEDPLP